MNSKKNIIVSLYRRSTVARVEDKFELLGDDIKFSSEQFINLHFFTTPLIFFIMLYVLNLGYVLAPFVTILYYYLFEYLILDIPIKKRTKKLDREALHFFEILTLTLESGRNLENSLEVTCFNVDSELSFEFKKALFEIKFGKSLIEALENMKRRIPSEAVNNIVLNITQTDIFGSSILETMYNQVEFLREKQILEIKEQINKIPNKVSIISVLFIVPLIMLMILGPIAIDLIQGTMG